MIAEIPGDRYRLAADGRYWPASMFRFALPDPDRFVLATDDKYWPAGCVAPGGQIVPNPPEDVPASPAGQPKGNHPQ